MFDEYQREYIDSFLKDTTYIYVYINLLLQIVS